MKFAVTTLGAVALVLLAIASSGSARPEGSAVDVQSSSTSTTSATNAEGEGTPSTTTAVPEESKMSKFFDDFSSAFKTGTAKVKESFESAASSVKDGVLRGYGFVKDKLTGSSDATAATPSNETVTAGSTTTTAAAAVTPTAKVVSARSITGNSATAKAIGVEPNDEEAKDEDKLIFIGDEDTATDSVVPTTVTSTVAPAATGSSSTVKTKLDDRWIIDGPTACKTGQTVVNGKCRNTF